MSSPPPKFVTIGGVRSISKEWREFKKAQQQDSSSTPATAETSHKPNEKESLAIISGFGDISSQLGEGTEQSQSVKNSLTKIQNDARFSAASLSNLGLPPPPSILDQLGKVFAAYETPVGMLQKLLLITEYDEIDIVCDDSGSIRKPTAACVGIDPKTNEPISRWEETEQRIRLIFEFLVWLPFPKITIRFLNNQKVGTISQDMMKMREETPEQFLQYVSKTLLKEAFDWRPTGQTPYVEAIRACLDRVQSSGKKVIQLLFSDGRPDGEQKSVNAISDMLMNRPRPKEHPVTFLTVTDNSKDIEWCQEIEGQVPFCAEYGNYEQERDEVKTQQSSVFPMSKGFWLIGCSGVGAIDEVLDNLDDAQPIAKCVLDDLQGYICSPEEYKYYFDSFIAAQEEKFQAKRDEKEEDRNSGKKKNKRHMQGSKHQARIEQFQESFLPKWKENFEQFRTASNVRDIQVVKVYQAGMESEADGTQTNAKKQKSETIIAPIFVELQSTNNKSNKARSHNTTSSSTPAPATSQYQKMESEDSSNKQKKKEDGCPCVIQ